MTAHLISALLYAGRAEQERFYSQRLTLGVFHSHLAELRWIFNYRERHGFYPSCTAFGARFPELPLKKPAASLVALTQEAVDADTFDRIGRMVETAKQKHLEGYDVHTLVSHFRSEVEKLRDTDVAFVDQSLDSTLPVKDYTDFVHRKNAGVVSDPSPWPTFNSMVGYLDPGSLIVLAARTSLGKTWIAIHLADYWRTVGERVLFVSKEMPTKQIARRFEALIFGLPYTHLQRGTLPPVLLRRWRMDRQKKTASLSNVLITGSETLKGVGFSHIYTKVQQFKPTAIVVDGAYLIYPEEKTNGDRERFAVISATMKRMCLAYGLKGMVVLQANDREAEANSPTGVTTSKLGNIYGADNWAQDSDLVMMLNGKRGAPTRKLSLDKAREGTVGDWRIAFALDPFPQFKELSAVGATPTAGVVSFEGV